MPNPLYPHYSFTSPASVHDEEALTALELAGRLGAKMNEVISLVNNSDTANKEFAQNVEKEFDAVGNRIDQLKVDMDHEVYAEIVRLMQSGDFDREIDEYAGGLIAKVNQLIENSADTETASGVELIDARANASGLIHATTGEHVRHNERVTNSKLEGIASGVYEIPQDWKYMPANQLFNGTPFMLPEHGVSARITERFDIDVNGTTCRMMVRLQMGRLVNGKFQLDASVIPEGINPSYTGRIVYIPYYPDVCVLPQVSILSGSTVKLNDDIQLAVAAELGRVKIYTGKVENGGNFPGVHPVCATSSASEGLNPVFSMQPYGTKFMALASVLPLEWVHRVTCGPRYWMAAKIYRYNPATRQHSFVEALNVHNDAPCRGTACVLDFSDYGANTYALILMGRVPLYSEYDADIYDGNKFHKNEMLLGLNFNGHLNNFNVEWTKKDAVKSLLGPGSDIPRMNLELLKGLRHKTATGRWNREPYSDNPMNFIGSMQQFAGILYGGDFKGGTFFYNVSPQSYYTALLNPNSCAYIEPEIDTGAMPYGIVCAPFTSLVMGHEYPASTFSIRYAGEMTGFDTVPLNLREDSGDLRRYDVLTYGNGYSGHSVVLTDMIHVDDTLHALKFAESIHPATAETLNPRHNGAPFANMENPENVLLSQYTFRSRAVKGSGRLLHDRANWEVPYTSPAPVMCNRGYGGLYVLGSTRVYLSIDPAVTRVTLRKRGASEGTVINVNSTMIKKNGYYLEDVTDWITEPGEWEAFANDSEVVERFGVISYPANINFNVRLEGDKYVCTVPNNPNPYYVVVTYKFTNGDHAGEYPSLIVPATNGQVEFPVNIVTDIGTCTYAATITRPLTCVYRTQYDSNTYAISNNGMVFV